MTDRINKLPPSPNVDDSVSKPLWDWLIKIGKTVNQLADRADIGAAWNENHFTMGDYHLWVDGSGRLRMKSGPPSGDTDGTIVGTQT
ncbi:MAG: hypothetical protein P4N59_23715 [Negativicutes bacterium]|nr:hypothetical protein [Negativicutes bacterium]